MPPIIQYKWYTIDEARFPSISLPCLQRRLENGTVAKYLCVRLIEATILMQFENLDSEEIRNHGRLNSVSIDTDEIHVLNEINEHFNFGLTYNQDDTLVKLEDFLVFYEILSRTCRIKQQQQPPPPPPSKSSRTNTVVRQNSNASSSSSSSVSSSAAINALIAGVQSSILSSQQPSRIVSNQSPLQVINQPNQQQHQLATHMRQFPNNQANIPNADINNHHYYHHINQTPHQSSHPQTPHNFHHPQQQQQQQQQQQRSSSVNSALTTTDFILNPDSILNQNHRIQLQQQQQQSNNIPRPASSSYSNNTLVSSTMPLVNQAVFLASHHHHHPILQPTAQSNIIINNPTIAVHHHHHNQTSNNLLIQNQLMPSLLHATGQQQMTTHARPNSRASSADLNSNQIIHHQSQFNHQSHQYQQHIQHPSSSIEVPMQRLSNMLVSSSGTNSQGNYLAQMHDPYQRITNSIGSQLTRASSVSHLNVNSNIKTNHQISNIQFNPVQQQQQQIFLNQSHLQSQHQQTHAAKDYLQNPLLERVNASNNFSPSRSLSPQQELQGTNKNISSNNSHVSRAKDSQLFTAIGLSIAPNLIKSNFSLIFRSNLF